jgi:hypothetical protein
MVSFVLRACCLRGRDTRACPSRGQIVATYRGPHLTTGAARRRLIARHFLAPFGSSRARCTGAGPADRAGRTVGPPSVHPARRARRGRAPSRRVCGGGAWIQRPLAPLEFRRWSRAHAGAPQRACRAVAGGPTRPAGVVRWAADRAARQIARSTHPSNAAGRRRRDPGYGYTACAPTARAPSGDVGGTACYVGWVVGAAVTTRSRVVRHAAPVSLPSNPLSSTFPHTHTAPRDAARVHMLPAAEQLSRAVAEQGRASALPVPVSRARSI